ncbi:MAG: hypothetical protein HY810_03340 [Candidatus Omnitrophica bacterium]|nr:hypothetical protein [Candidatus Omnitrophota bacterium]
MENKDIKRMVLKAVFRALAFGGLYLSIVGTLKGNSAMFVAAGSFIMGVGAALGWMEI